MHTRKTGANLGIGPLIARRQQIMESKQQISMELYFQRMGRKPQVRRQKVYLALGCVVGFLTCYLQNN